MKKLLTIALATAFALSVQAAPNAKTGLEHTVMPQVKELGVKPEVGLFVGNSYFYYNNAVGSHVKNFVKAGGDKFSQSTNTISGVSLYWHEVKGYLKKHYDVVVMQYTTQNQLKNAAKDRAALEKNCKDIREAKGVPMVMIPWAMAGSIERTSEIADIAIKDANDMGIMAAPVGLAFAKCLKKHPQIVLIQKDKNHSTPAGTVLSAAVMYATMFHRSPVGYAYKPVGVGTEVDGATVATLEQVAWDTVTDFFGWKK